MEPRPALFTVLDKDGVPITLTQDTWYDKLLHPVIGHPEVEPYLEEIKQTILEPEFVYQSIKDERTLLLYRSGLTRGKFAHCFVLVVVRYVEEDGEKHGYVSTVLLARSLKKGVEPIWTKENFT